MVTSTSTPGSMEMEVICLTISEGEWRSMRRLWMRISKRSQVSEPLPQGDLRVVMRRTLVGRRTGPLTLSCLSLERWIRSEQTFSRFLTLREVKVMRIRWILEEQRKLGYWSKPPICHWAHPERMQAGGTYLTSADSSKPGFWVVGLAYW